MNHLKKIQALQSGQFDKVLEGGPYGDKSIYRHQTMVAYPYAGQQLAMKDGLANAAKVEVTKGVLDDVVSYLEGRRETTIVEPEESLTLLKTLRDALKT